MTTDSDLFVIVIIYDRKAGGFVRFAMRVLYVIFVICMGALLWAAFSAARHIRRHDGKAELLGKAAQRAVEPLPEDKDIVLPVDK